MQFPFETFSRILSSAETMHVVLFLVEDAQWFDVMPLPWDKYEVTVKAENGFRLNQHVSLFWAMEK